LINYLSHHLPDYMIPRLWVDLPELPLTKNGKVDKKALPDIEMASWVSDNFVAPRNILEKKIAEVWKEILQTDLISIYDNFFHLGGHSLLVFPVINKLRKLGINLSFKELFLNPSIEKLSVNQSINNEKNKDIPSAYLDLHVHHLNKESKNDIVFLIPGSPGLTDAYRELGDALDDLFQVYGLQWIGLQRGETPLSTMEENAKWCKKWIQEIQPGGPYKLIGHSVGAHLAYEIIKQLEQDGQTVEVLIILDASINTAYVRNEKEGTTIDERLILLSESLISTYRLPSLQSGWQKELINRLIRTEEDNKGTVVMEYLHAHIKEDENKEFILRAFNTTIIQFLIKYTPSGFIGSNILVIKSEKGTSPDIDFIEWKKHTKSTFKMVHSPGDHMSMIYNYNALQIALIIKEHLFNKNN